MLQRVDIFLARPTHLGPTLRKETQKGAVYQLARTCTQERLMPCSHQFKQVSLNVVFLNMVL